MTIKLPNDLQLDNDFWQFSLSLWQNENVQKILLTLQDVQHLRINLMLFSMWLGIERKSVTEHIITSLEVTESWHLNIIGPLRNIRKSLPTLPTSTQLKPQVQNSELLAEQIEQSLLFKCAINIPRVTTTINAHHPDNTLTILIKNLLASTNHAQSIQQLNTVEHPQNKNISRLSHSDLLLLVQACLPIHPESHIKACIDSLTHSQ
jgi:uncharacterized protein (TIGR02444 family)